MELKIHGFDFFLNMGNKNRKPHRKKHFGSGFKGKKVDAEADVTSGDESLSEIPLTDSYFVR